MRKLTADWVFDGKQLHRHSVLVLEDDGKVAALLPRTEGTDAPAEAYASAAADAEYFEGLLSPGFINAHCHLELSHMKGMLPRAGGLVNFILDLQRMRPAAPELQQEAMTMAEKEMLAGGIVAVGDIANSATSFALKEVSPLIYHNFLEVFGFDPRRAAGIMSAALALQASIPEKCPAGIVPHAPYSVSEELFRLIAGETAKSGASGLLSIHNQESAHEDPFYQTGNGEFRRLYREFGIDISFYRPPGKRALASWLPYLDTPARLLLVHNTYTKAEDIELAAASGDTWWCLCPGANLYIEERLPDVPLFIKKGTRLLLGTDSLASNDGLNLLEEMKMISAHFPEVGLEQLLQWATHNGAAFFGWDQLGGFKRGKTPGVNLLTGLDKGLDSGLRPGKYTQVRPLIGARI